MSSVYKDFVESKKQSITKEKEFSTEKKSVLDKLSVEKNLALKQVKYAEQQENYYRKRISSMPTQQSETMYGSNIAEALFAATQDKYHATRWLHARKSIRRRYLRLTKIIDRKTR